MKKTILPILPAVILGIATLADTQVRLAWDPNPAAEGEITYALEYWPSNSSTRFVTNSGAATSAVVTITDAVPWTFRVRAIGQFQTSAPSTEIKLQVRPTPPKGLTVSVPDASEVKVFAR